MNQTDRRNAAFGQTLQNLSRLDAVHQTEPDFVSQDDFTYDVASDKTIEPAVSLDENNRSRLTEFTDERSIPQKQNDDVVSNRERLNKIQRQDGRTRTRSLMAHDQDRFEQRVEADTTCATQLRQRVKTALELTIGEIVRRRIHSSGAQVGIELQIYVGSEIQRSLATATPFLQSHDIPTARKSTSRIRRAAARNRITGFRKEKILFSRK